VSKTGSPLPQTLLPPELKSLPKMNTASEQVVNGIKVQEVQGLIEAVKKEPQIAQAKFYATTTWTNGFRNEASIKDFALGGVQNSTSRAKPFTVAGDHPPELLGTNEGPSSVELALAALGHCIASGFSVYGAHMGVPIKSLVVEVQGDIDLQGMLALPEPGKVRQVSRRSLPDTTSRATLRANSSNSWRNSLKISRRQGILSELFRSHRN